MICMCSGQLFLEEANEVRNGQWENERETASAKNNRNHHRHKRTMQTEQKCFEFKSCWVSKWATKCISLCFIHSWELEENDLMPKDENDFIVAHKACDDEDWNGSFLFIINKKWDNFEDIINQFRWSRSARIRSNGNKTLEPANQQHPLKKFAEIQTRTENETRIYFDN